MQGINKIAIAVTGASGSVYAKVLLDKVNQLQNQISEISVVYSDNAKDVWKLELGNTDYLKYPFKVFEKEGVGANLQKAIFNAETRAKELSKS